jgi:hypothetical protein
VVAQPVVGMTAAPGPVAAGAGLPEEAQAVGATAPGAADRPGSVWGAVAARAPGARLRAESEAAEVAGVRSAGARRAGVRWAGWIGAGVLPALTTR